MTALRIGLDFDNTLVDYDRVFASVARESGLAGPEFKGGKRDVRALCVARANGETDWMRFQGRVYGALMSKAEFMKGADAFLFRCRDAGARLFVVSHKTDYGHFDPDRVNLRDAARAWMRDNGFFAKSVFAMSADDIFFESDRAAKIARIATLRCTHFVDDLEEVLNEPGFPANTRRILFTDGRAAAPGPYLALPDWNAIGDAVLGCRH